MDDSPVEQVDRISDGRRGYHIGKYGKHCSITGNHGNDQKEQRKQGTMEKLDWRAGVDRWWVEGLLSNWDPGCRQDEHDACVGDVE